MKSKTNRKLKRRVVFVTQKTYNMHQAIITNWYMEKHNSTEMEAFTWYINSGLAEAFEKKHKPHNLSNEIIVSEMGQKIN